MNLRLAEPKDNEAIRAIYNQEVVATTSTFDTTLRSEQEQIQWLKQHSGKYSVVVAERPDGQVIAFGAITRYRERSGYLTTAELSCYILPDYRRQKIGSDILAWLERTAFQHGFKTLIIRISTTNQPSCAMIAASGYEQVGVEKRIAYKFGQWLDVNVYQKFLG